jgi:hypothetical protein
MRTIIALHDMFMEDITGTQKINKNDRFPPVDLQKIRKNAILGKLKICIGEAIDEI